MEFTASQTQFWTNPITWIRHPEIIKSLVEEYGWEAIEETLWEAANTAPEEHFDDVSGLLAAAILLNETENLQLARLPETTPVIH